MSLTEPGCPPYTPEEAKRISAWRSKLRMKIVRDNLRNAEKAYARVMATSGRQWTTTKTADGWDIEPS